MNQKLRLSKYYFTAAVSQRQTTSADPFIHLKLSIMRHWTQLYPYVKNQKAEWNHKIGAELVDRSMKHYQSLMYIVILLFCFCRLKRLLRLYNPGFSYLFNHISVFSQCIVNGNVFHITKRKRFNECSIAWFEKWHKTCKQIAHTIVNWRYLKRALPNCFINTWPPWEYSFPLNIYVHRT